MIRQASPIRDESSDLPTLLGSAGSFASGSLKDWDGAIRSFAKIDELEWNAEVFSFQRSDHRLKIVTLLP